MTLSDYQSALAYVQTVTGDAAGAVMDFRAIHDTDKAIPAIPFRGTIAECWRSIEHYSAQGYGIFVCPNALDGQGRELANVQYIRAHYIDLDNLSAQQNYERASGWQPVPSFAVQSSPGKFHVYWVVQPYAGNDYFTLQQRKLRQLFDGDKSIIDATRVMRLPGTWHRKNPDAPHLVTCWGLAGYGTAQPVTMLETALAGVNVIDGGHGERKELGDPDLAAPSLDWLQRALDLTDPNTLDRGEWIAFTAGVKQAGWTLAEPQQLFDIWSNWCAKYEGNDLGENRKQWDSIRNTELGWKSVLRRTPQLQAMISFGGTSPTPPAATSTLGAPPSMPDVSAPPPLDCSGEYLTHLEQQEWFKGCHFVVAEGGIFTPSGRVLKPAQFNGAYGGKLFIIGGQNAKTTNEAWQAATRSTLWTIPKVDHRRFVPREPQGAVIVDALGRHGINTYKPIIVERKQGDATPFLQHIAKVLPNPGDQQILLSYLAHNAKYPGHKIPWAPVIQSAEGVGKGVIKKIMLHIMGRPYVHFPNAKELTESGAKFNNWMRFKTFLLADEIKVDDRRDLIEVLKPMISEEIIEVQPKGVDSELEDNFSNWLFFTNWRDAIPISRNARRFCIFYSAIQTFDELIAAGMTDDYFNRLYKWLDGDGCAIVADWLMNYPIEAGALPMRAPITTSTGAAIVASRSPLERAIVEAIEDGLQGFRGGWVSNVAAAARARENGAVRGTVAPNTIGTILEGLGYVSCGRAPRAYFQEERGQSRPYLWHFGGVADSAAYGQAQGYE